MFPCHQIQYQFSNDILNFRDKKFTICAAGIPSFEIFDQGILRRRAFFYKYKNYTIHIKKSDYGRSKLYKFGHSLTLYVALSSREDFLKQEICEFVIEQKDLEIMLYGICSFNYNNCQNCPNIGCTYKTNFDTPPERILSDELFEI